MTAKIFAFPVSVAAFERLDMNGRETRQKHRTTHAHLMQEAFAEQELAGEELSWTKAIARVRFWFEELERPA